MTQENWPLVLEGRDERLRLRRVCWVLVTPFHSWVQLWKLCIFKGHWKANHLCFLSIENLLLIARLIVLLPLFTNREKLPWKGISPSYHRLPHYFKTWISSVFRFTVWPIKLVLRYNLCVFPVPMHIEWGSFPHVWINLSSSVNLLWSSAKLSRWL